MHTLSKYSSALMAQACGVPQLDDLDDATLQSTFQALQAQLARREGLKLVSLSKQRTSSACNILRTIYENLSIRLCITMVALPLHTMQDAQGTLFLPETQ